MLDSLQGILVDLLFFLTKEGEAIKVLDGKNGYVKIQKSWAFGKLENKDKSLDRLKSISENACKPLSISSESKVNRFVYNIYFYDFPYKFMLEFKGENKPESITELKSLFDFLIESFIIDTSLNS